MCKSPVYLLNLIKSLHILGDRLPVNMENLLSLINPLLFALLYGMATKKVLMMLECRGAKKDSYVLTGFPPKQMVMYAQYSA